MNHVPKVTLGGRQPPFRRLCAHALKVARHLERPGVASVTLFDMYRSEPLLIVSGSVLIVALIVEITADSLEAIRRKR